MSGATIPTRVAVIGAGQWGQQHTRVFAGHPDSEVCAVVARHQRPGGGAGRAMGSARLYVHS